MGRKAESLTNVQLCFFRASEKVFREPNACMRSRQISVECERPLELRDPSGCAIGMDMDESQRIVRERMPRRP